MKRRLLGVVLALGTLFSVGLVGAVVESAPALAATGTTTCTTNGLSPYVITTNLNVPAGAACTLYGNEVKGNVTVQGSLLVFGATFDQNVSVTGGSFAGANWGVTIKGNLSFLDPATGSYNGFWGNYSANDVTGNLSYVIDSSAAYPCYNSPLLYFGGGTTVHGNFNYSDQGTGFAGHLDTGGLAVMGKMSILLGTGSC